jgi:hypothetical protein
MAVKQKTATQHSHPRKGRGDDMASDQDLKDAAKVLTPEVMQRIESDIDSIQPSQKPGELGKVGPLKAVALDLDSAKLQHDPDEMKMVEGGNGQVYPDIIHNPNTIAADTNIAPHDQQPILLHEAAESLLMQAGKKMKPNPWPYNRAHTVANTIEETYRRKHGIGTQQQQGPPPVMTPLGPMGGAAGGATGQPAGPFGPLMGG